ncbi:hypothetical protein O181_027435 [Austropuccinia psidii MF-1]|uniref:Uncharacterized protein n=1 Tax=Austropuccinia psidii MF-1 TaxID=1389203 RepID=A0A9Q3H377_9BASI|nr:hypothetical protein [Austropuccinia psidii MF-1]
MQSVILPFELRMEAKALTPHQQRKFAQSSFFHCAAPHEQTQFIPFTNNQEDFCYASALTRIIFSFLVKFQNNRFVALSVTRTPKLETMSRAMIQAIDSGYRDDEARLRDYKMREARRGYAQDCDEAEMDYRTRIRGRASQQDYAGASLLAKRLNHPPIPSPSSNGRYESKPELRADRHNALEAEAFQRRRNKSLEYDLNKEKSLNKCLQKNNEHLLVEVGAHREREASYRLAALRPQLCLHSRTTIVPYYSAAYDLGSLALGLDVEEEYFGDVTIARRYP